jgi:hypothetical protein
LATPDYVLEEDYSHWINGRDQVLLKAGTFVRPIEFKYLPAEIRKEVGNEFVASMGTILFCYTSVGIISIPKSIVRKL